jgi:hypothetical protein
MKLTKLFGVLLFQFGLVSFAGAQVVNITGTLTDDNSRKVANAIVKLKKLQMVDTTDANGVFSFIRSSAGKLHSSSIAAKPFFSGKFLTFTVASSNDRVSIETFDCRGRCVSAIRNRVMAAGTYRTNPLPEGYSTQMYFCRVSIGNSVATLRSSPLVSEKAAGSGAAPLSYFAKQAAAVDTLIITHAGYAYKKSAIDSYSGNYPITLTVDMSVRFDLDSYQGIADPMNIDVNDPYATANTVDVILSTSVYHVKDTVKIPKVAGKPGNYSASVYFTIKSAKTGNDTIRTKDNDSITATYKPSAPLTTVSTSVAIWNALQPSVRPAVSIYLGLKNPITVNAEDRNITDPSITLHIASKKDTVGFDLVIPQVPGSQGSYSGPVGATLTTSVAGKILAVRPPDDTLTTRYQSPATFSPVVSSAAQGTALLWKANTVNILPDSLGTGYHGTNSKMGIYMENDHIVATTLNVKVTSKKDPTGITIPMTVDKDTSWIFHGSVGFTTGASSATNAKISVAGSDTVTVSYYDAVMIPAETRTQYATWNP